MSNIDIILVGGGGHCKSCIEVVESTKMYNIIGVIDLNEKLGESILGYNVIGTDRDLEKIRQTCQYALVTIGQIKNSELRKKAFDRLKELDFTLPVIKASTAYVSSEAKIGEGTIIMHYGFINSNSKIGKNSIVNTGALVEHDVVVGDYNHISTRATLNGGVKIGDNCFIGSNTVVNHGVEICSGVVFGANSTVVKDIINQGVYVGSPAKLLNE